MYRRSRRRSTLRWRGHSHQLYNDVLAPLAVEFGVEGALPGAKVEVAIGDGKRDLVVQQQRLEVRVCIVFAGLVMAELGARGGEFFKPLFDVCDEAAFVIIDVNGSGNVHGGDEAEAVTDATAGDDLLQLRGDVD